MKSADVQANECPDRAEMLRQGREYSRKLANSHYENFAVASWLLPSDIRRDLFNIYAFSRMADDAADENQVGNTPAEKLDEIEQRLEAAVQGVLNDPLSVALGETINRRELPLQLFKDLLSAFRIDLTKTRYANWAELNEYTKLSANPVGRLVLHLYGEKKTINFDYSDKICTALQLANHWQDIREDFFKGRIYIPQEDLNRFGVTEADIEKGNFNNNFRDLMIFEVDRAEQWFEDGKPLLKQVRGSLAAQLEMYWRGGMAALNAIRKIDYNVLQNSPKVSRHDKIKIAFLSFRRFL